MAKKPEEPKIILEREYIIPLRKEFLKVPKYKRANKAVKAIKQFIVKHMKVYDRDLKKVKIDINLNNELRFRGMKKPPAKIKIKAKKFDNDKVLVELVNIPEIIRFKLAREEKKKKETEKKTSEEKKKAEEAKAAAKKAKKEEAVEEKVETSEEKREKEEKKQSVKEAGLKESKAVAKQAKHVSGGKKQPKIKRMALQK